MVKANIKRNSSDKVNSKKNKDNKPSLNPFEVHINKQKHNVLGQKLKNDRGLPGVSRAKAIKKRKHTLLQEYNLKNKANKFMDRRIGEKNFSMTSEDKQMARFTAERMKKHNKKSIYNLADEEVLTHRGQTLTEIEKFDDPRSDDDDDDDLINNKSGKLDDTFVEDAHFGGGILKKSGTDGAKSHKDLIEQLITESKKRKAEKQKIREQTIELTEKIDSEWKDLLPLVNKSKKDNKEIIEEKSVDPYDKAMRELRFEARGQPSDRLKSEEEIAKEEKIKLEKLEQERLNRMNGVVEETKSKLKHRSADDLDDDFAFESNLEPETMLAYNEDGTCIINPEDNKINESSDKEMDENDEDDDNSENDDDSEDEDDESEDDLSDLKQSESESSDSEQIEIPKETPKSQKKKEKTTANITEKNTIENKKNKQHEESIMDTITKMGKEYEINDKKDDLKNTNNTTLNEKKDVTNIVDEKDKIKEAAAKELPYVFTIPENYEELQTLLDKYNPTYQSIIIERMIKCNHPNLSINNKQGLGRLFAYLLQYFNDISSEPEKCFAVLNSLIKHMFDLTQLNKESIHQSFIEVIKEKQGDFKKNMKSYPSIEVLVFLKLIGTLFPTSDLRHQIVTPTIIFIGQLLMNCRNKTRYDISYGIFLVTLLLEYVSFSKRLIPQALTHLTGLLHMAIPKTGVQVIRVTPPFKPNSTLLVLIKKTNVDDLKMNVKDFTDEEIDENFKVKVLYNCVKLIDNFYNIYKDLPSCDEIFKPVLNFIEKVPIDNYPKEVQETVNNIKNVIKNGMSTRKLEYIVLAAKKPKALRLYEPNIVKIYEGKNHKIMSKEKAEKEKLLHKYKKEMKGALREIRRDKAFLGRVKLKQQMQSDMERKEKVKRIYAEANMQQAELNAMDRKKKRI